MFPLHLVVFTFISFLNLPMDVVLLNVISSLLVVFIVTGLYFIPIKSTIKSILYKLIVFGIAINSFTFDYTDDSNHYVVFVSIALISMYFKKELYKVKYIEKNIQEESIIKEEIEKFREPCLPESTYKSKFHKNNKVYFSTFIEDYPSLLFYKLLYR